MNMNLILALLLCSFVRVRCETVFQNDPGVVVLPERQRVEKDRADVLASVREYPAYLHRCTATFIAPDLLLTTAKCLYCEDCHLFVHALSCHLTDDGQRTKGQSYNVSKTVLHPNFEADPKKNDIGLIKLTTKVKQAVVFGLPTKLHEVPGQDVITYTWQFSPNLQEYYLEKVIVKTISNEVCSLFFNRYVDYSHVCSRKKEANTLGPFDEGVPMIENVTGKGVIIGIFVPEGGLKSTKLDIYRSIYPHVGWLEKVIKCGLTCTSSTTETTLSKTGPKIIPSTSAPTSPDKIANDKSFTATLSAEVSKPSSGRPVQSTSKAVTEQPVMVNVEDATSADNQKKVHGNDYGEESGNDYDQGF